MKKYYNILHNAGLSNEEYRIITPNFMQENVKNLSMYSLMLALFFLVLSFVSIFGPGFVTTNSGLYLIIGSVMLLITICTRIILKKKNYPVSLVCILIYLFIIALYVEATYVTILHPESPSVTFIGLLLVIPLLFCLRPCNLIISQVLYTIVFCFCVKYHKAPECATIDIWNVLSFLVVSIAAILLVIPMRVRSLHNAIQLEYLSTHDLLTGLKNRNCFEQVLLQYENQQNTTLCCIYMDANGLHHINNTLGHGAGDGMLKAVAATLQEVFGKDDTYRIGGDEFVVLSDSLTLEDASSCSDQVRTILQVKGYQLSLGIVKGAGAKEDMPKTVIKAAEKKMYADKSSFYRTSGIDRRRS